MRLHYGINDLKDIDLMQSVPLVLPVILEEAGPPELA